MTKTGSAVTSPYALVFLVLLKVAALVAGHALKQKGREKLGEGGYQKIAGLTGSFHAPNKSNFENRNVAALKGDFSTNLTR
jgi:hypothetical protein